MIKTFSEKLEYGHKFNDTNYYKMILYDLQQKMKCLKSWNFNSFLLFQS